MEFVHIDTDEGRRSFALATREFVVRGWLDDLDEIEVLGCEVQAVGYEAECLIGTDSKSFAFAGDREQFFALVRRSSQAEEVLTDSRIKTFDR